MAITPVPGSATITITHTPSVTAPTFNMGGAASPMTSSAHFGSQHISATGSVSLTGSPGDHANGYTLGFIQSQYVETNWVYYRGRHNNDGSVFLQRARPPARPHQACRDTVHNNPNLVWYNNTQNHSAPAPGTAFPITLNNARFYDRPSDSADLMTTNTHTGKINFLHEVQLEFAFCTTLVLRTSAIAGAFTQLAHFYWNVRWQYRFQPSANPGVTPWTSNSTAAGTASAVGRINSGAVTDHRFTGVLTAHVAQNCNQVFQHAVAHPVRRESNVWSNFNVK